MNLREARREDFDALWRLDQDCFPPGISYSRLELGAYLRRKGAISLVAEAVAALKTKSSNAQYVPLLGFIVAQVEGGAAKKEDDDARIDDIRLDDDRADSNHQPLVTAQHVTGHIITIDVAAKARRTGVGSLLLDAVEDRLDAAGCRIVNLEVAVDNAAAIAFYRRHRYAAGRTISHYYSNGADALVMTRQLSSTGNLV